jgi:hypothetical protein
MSPSLLSLLSRPANRAQRLLREDGVARLLVGLALALLPLSALPTTTVTLAVSWTFLSCHTSLGEREVAGTARAADACFARQSNYSMWRDDGGDGDIFGGSIRGWQLP